MGMTGLVMTPAPKESGRLAFGFVIYSNNRDGINTKQESPGNRDGQKVQALWMATRRSQRNEHEATTNDREPTTPAPELTRCGSRRFPIPKLGGHLCDARESAGTCDRWRSTSSAMLQDFFPQTSVASLPRCPLSTPSTMASAMVFKLPET